jgi:two-component system KDP operon response regulator KdpE
MNATSGKLTVLIVDDEQSIRRLLRTSLESQRYHVIEAYDGEAALALADQAAVDLWILDLGLPGMDGFEVIKKLRASGSTVPVVVLSSRVDEVGKVRALDLGADDYVTKPFGVDELLARVRTALRHRLQEGGERPIFKSGGLSVDLVRRIVQVREKEVKLTPREYDLLRLLITHAGKVMTHRYILHEVWGAEADVQYLRVLMRSLRQKIEDDPAQPTLITTEQGVGYRLNVDD